MLYVVCALDDGTHAIRASHDGSQEDLVRKLPDYAGCLLVRWDGQLETGSPVVLSDLLADGAEWLNPPETLLGYAARRRWEILDEGRIQVGQASVPTNDYTQGKLTGGALKATRNPAYTIKSWKVAEGLFVVLDAQTIIRFADAVEERVQELFDRESDCTDAILAGTMTTTEQVEAILSAPTQVGVS